MMKPLLSIVIPTKNRYETLIPVVNSLLNHILSTEYEIVLQDNSENNQPAIVWLKLQQDKRIKYFYIDENISMMENTNLAFENSNGEYILFIGDDDFVSPYVVDVIRMMQEKDIENLIYPCGYYWWRSVDFSSENYYHRKEAFWLPKKMDCRLQKKNSSEELDRVLKNGAVHYYNLPRVYHGLTKRMVLERIKNKIGVYLIGSCPDMAFSISAALVMDSYYYINYPISVFGGCRNSGAGMVAKKSHYAKIENVSFLPSNIDKIWNKHIPYYWSANTIYAQSAYEVLQAFNSKRRINFIPHYASILINEKPLIEAMLPLLFRYAKFNLLKYIEFLVFCGRKCVGRILWQYKCNHKKMPYYVFVLENAEEVMMFLEKYPYGRIQG